LTAKLHSRYVNESEILKRSDILPPTPQPWLLNYNSFESRLKRFELNMAMLLILAPFAWRFMWAH